MANTQVIKTKFTAVDKFTRKVKKMSAATSRFSKKASIGFARLNRFTRKVSKGFKNMLGQLGRLGLAFGVFAILSSGVKTIANFEQANADLSAVMATATRPQLVALQKDAKRLGATTAKSATEIVSLQEAFARLGFETPDIINMTESTVNGAVAMNAELADTAELVGAMVRTFDNFTSMDTPEIIDQMTLATQRSALNFEKLQTALPIVAGAANSAGVPFTRLLALLGKLSDAGIDASSSSTALRNIFLESSAQGLSYDQILDKIANSTDQLTMSNDEFGKRAAVPANILAKQLKQTNELDKILRSAARGMGILGVAEQAAEKRSDTLTGRVILLQSAWKGFILSLDDGSGKFSKIAKNAVELATEILSIASGTEKSKDELDAHEKVIRKWAERGFKFVKILGKVLVLFLALKVATAAYNAVLAIQNIISGIAAAKQWLLNAAMAANPIGLIVAAIVIFIAYMAIVIKKFDKFGAVLAYLWFPIWGVIINAVMAFKKNWQGIIDLFKKGDILGGLKLIGATILDVILYPLQQLFGLLSKLPKIGSKFGALQASTQAIRDKLSMETGMDSSVTKSDKLNPDAAVNEQRVKMSKQEKVDIGVTGQNGAIANILNNTGANIRINNTNGWTPPWQTQ